MIHPLLSYVFVANVRIAQQGNDDWAALEELPSDSYWYEGAPYYVDGDGADCRTVIVDGVHNLPAISGWELVSWHRASGAAPCPDCRERYDVSVPCETCGHASPVGSGVIDAGLISPIEAVYRRLPTF